MAVWQLLIDPEGRLVIATAEPVGEDRKASIQAAFDAWRASPPGRLLIAGESEVVRVESIELHLEEAS